MTFSERCATVLAAAIILSIVILASLVSGCMTEPSGPVPFSRPMVNLAVSFSESGSTGLTKSATDLFADSLHIDSAVVVFSRIQFLPHPDSVRIDSGDDEHDSDDGESDGRGDSLTFKGPFVVHVRDTVGISFASRELPAGVYTAIRFKIHRLIPGEHFEDSDEHNHHGHAFLVDSTIGSSSITVWGSIHKNGEWTPFTFRFDGEFEFKVRGNFVVPTSTHTVNFALHIDMGKWFKNPTDGSLLDPTDTSHENLVLFRRAIRAAFNSCTGGHDRGDGHPDD